MGEPDIRYIVFPVWLLLIVPTVLTVYFLQGHIDYVAETLPDFPEDQQPSRPQHQMP
uniref:PIG-P domain-containing protein n=1 Tax=Tetranychus urticae TaxID=32264 RepID=T1KRR1_TETUR